MKWGHLRTLCWAFLKSKDSKFTKAECDAFFRSPVWAFIVQRAALRMAVLFDVIGNPEAPEKTVAIARLGIGNTSWILQLETETRQFVEDQLTPEDQKVRDLVIEAVNALSKIPVSEKDQIAQNNSQ